MYASAGTLARQEQSKLHTDLADFTIIGEDVQEEEFLSEEAVELPIAAALVQERLVAAGLSTNTALDKSAAVYIAGVLEHALTKMLASAGRIATARGDTELQERHLVQALHTDMQAILMPFLSRALQQATPSSSMTSAALLQVEEPPANDTTESFLLEPLEGILHQRSAMSTFLVDDYEPSGGSPADRVSKPPRINSAELSLTPTLHSFNEEQVESLPVASSVIVLSSSPTILSSPSLSLRAGHSALAEPHVNVLVSSRLGITPKTRDRRYVPICSRQQASPLAERTYSES